MKEINIDTEEIENFFLKQLTIRGYVPTDEEIIALGDITFDFLVHKGIIDEVEEDDS